jgi:hypothetical protein
MHLAKALPKSLPWFLALPFLAFQIEKVATAIANGPSSSTAAVAYPFVIMGAALLWLFGWILGKAVDRVLPRGIGVHTVSIPIIVGVLVIVTAGSGFLGRRSGLSVVKDLAAAVLIDEHRLEPVAGMVASGPVVPGQVVLNGSGKIDTVTIGGQLLRFEKDLVNLKVANARSNDHVVIALPLLDVPFQVEIVPVHVAADQPAALAMMIVGSMRSRQAMLAILDPAWRLVYQERLLRSWPIRSPTLQVRPDSVTGRDLLIVTESSTQRFYHVTAR